MRGRWWTSSWLLAGVVLGGFATPARAQQAPLLTVEPSGVVASGLTPRGGVAWLGVSRQGNGTYVSVELTQKQNEADAGGLASLAFEDEVPARSIWAVVDISTGAFSVAAPDTFPLQEEPFEISQLGVGPGGSLDRLLAPHERLLALAARPGVGAWAVKGGDGKQGDTDGLRNGIVTLRLADFKPLLSEQRAPVTFADGDVVIWIDMRRMSYSAASLELSGPGVQP